MNKIVIAIIFSMCIVSCVDIIEPSLEKEKVVLLAPKDTQSSIYAQSFTFEKLQNATYYQIQIAIPNFDSAQHIFMDTNITSNVLRVTLAPQRYELRVKAFNGSSNTDWTYKKMTIIASNLSFQTVVLASPEDGRNSNVNLFRLQWQPLFGVTKYKIQIDTVPSFSSTYIVQRELSAGAIYYNFTAPLEHVYYWRVKGVNNNDSTDWSQPYYQFVYDNTPPEQVTDGSPNDNTSRLYARDSTISWRASRDAGVSYTVKIQYGNTSPVSVGPTLSTSTSYTATTNQTITWWVLATDKAGNVTPEASVNKYYFKTR